MGVPVRPGAHDLGLGLASGDGTPRAGTAQAWLVGAERVEPVKVGLAARQPLARARPLPPSGLGPSELPVSVRLREVVLPTTSR